MDMKNVESSDLMPFKKLFMPIKMTGMPITDSLQMDNAVRLPVFDGKKMCCCSAAHKKQAGAEKAAPAYACLCCYTITFSIKRMRMAAAWARVALP